MWCLAFVEGAVAEHGEQDADAVTGEAEEGWLTADAAERDAPREPRLGRSGAGKG